MRTKGRAAILVLASYYLPGHKGGGPVRTLANVVRSLGDEFEFKIITRDRDPGDQRPYPGCATDQWTSVGKASVYYLSPGPLRIARLREAIAESRADGYYLNAFYELPLATTALILRRLRLIPHRPVLLAPRGQFSPAALRIKAVRKRLFLTVGRLLRLWRGCSWHFSSAKELGDALRLFPDAAERCEINLDLSVEVPAENPIPAKRRGELEVCYCGRVAPIKNLEFALEVLSRVQGRVAYHVYGPLEDAQYADACRRRINALPEHVSVVLHGAKTFEEIQAVYRRSHVMLMPSKGENFGHAIHESLAASCPVLISDRTPWTDLEAKHLGWDLSLSEPEAFVAVLQRLVDMDAGEYAGYRRDLHASARQHLEQKRLLPGYRRMFERLTTGYD